MEQIQHHEGRDERFGIARVEPAGDEGDVNTDGQSAVGRRGGGGHTAGDHRQDEEENGDPDTHRLPPEIGSRRSYHGSPRAGGLAIISAFS
jgi:hypothetical protein